MIVVTVFCLLLGTVIKPARDQWLAVEAIGALGGEVVYEHQRTNSEPPGPEWLRQLVGEEYFFSVFEVNLSGTLVNDATLAMIKRLTELKRFRHDDNLLTDAGLEHLSGLPNLEVLSLVQTQTSDAGLVHLKELRNLRSLFLYNNKITDAGLVHLNGLTNLQQLSLGQTRVTDAGWVHLQGLTNLTWLNLESTKVSDEGMKKYQRALPNCKIFYKNKDGSVKVLRPVTSSTTPQQ